VVPDSFEELQVRVFNDLFLDLLFLGVFLFVVFIHPRQRKFAPFAFSPFLFIFSGWAILTIV